MRKGCYDCCLKHLSKARVALAEVALGYPDHIMLVIGNLSEAEDEIARFSLDLADRIRNTRLKYMADFNADIEAELGQHFMECLGLRAVAAEKEKQILP
jgi:hypothetical protein